MHAFNFLGLAEETLTTKLQTVMSDHSTSDFAELYEMAERAVRDGTVEREVLSEVRMIFQRIQDEKPFIQSAVEYYMNHSAALTGPRLPVEPGPVELEEQYTYVHSVAQVWKAIRSAGGRAPRKGTAIRIEHRIDPGPS